MNRRGFLKILGAAGLVASVPATILPRERNPLLSGRLGSYDGFLVRRLPPQLSDFETQIGLGVSFQRGEDILRHAIRLPSAAWVKFTLEQREETWKLLERATYNVARKRPAWAGLKFPKIEVA